MDRIEREDLSLSPQVQWNGARGQILHGHRPQSLLEWFRTCFRACVDEMRTSRASQLVSFLPHSLEAHGIPSQARTESANEAPAYPVTLASRVERHVQHEQKGRGSSTLS